MRSTKKGERRRGRPRSFDEEEALRTAERLFAAHGYDAVTLQMLTGSMGIAPPSFYAAFGSKADLFERVAARYNAREGAGLLQAMQAAPDARAAVRALLVAAAKQYAADPAAPGCLVTEGARAACPEVAAGCTARGEAMREALRDRLGQTHPAAAEEASALVMIALSGLSAAARAGTPAGLLERFARLTAEGIAERLYSTASKAPATGG